MKVFFYGLFMSESLLATKGIRPTNIRVGFVDDYGLCIGKRATLIPRHGARAYGVVMVIAPSEVTELYADDSVADYVPEPVTVEFMDGTNVQASCYNLPSEKVSGTNKTYAESLLEVATKLQLPESYLDQIGQSAK